jgi:hypothetical protein
MNNTAKSNNFNTSFHLSFSIFNTITNHSIIIIDYFVTLGVLDVELESDQ